MSTVVVRRYIGNHNQRYSIRMDAGGRFRVYDDAPYYEEDEQILGVFGDVQTAEAELLRTRVIVGRVRN